MRLHASNIGMRQFSSILVTGGGSSNTNICKVVADVFGVPVFKAETSNSASLGAAYRALHGWLCQQRQAFVPFRYPPVGHVVSWLPLCVGSRIASGSNERQ
jgi:xylulokinase